MKTSLGGRYLTVHYLSNWSLLMIIFYATLNVYVWRTISNSNGSLGRDTAYVKTLTWLPAWVAFWLATTSFAVTNVLHLDSSARPVRAWYASAPVLNFLTVGVPIAVIVTIATLAELGAREYRGMLDAFQMLEQGLANAAQTYNGTLRSSVISTGVATASAMFAHLHKFTDYFRGTFCAYAGCTLLMEVLFAVVSTLQCVLNLVLMMSRAGLMLTPISSLKELRRSLGELQTKSKTTNEARMQQHILQSTYNQLLAVTYLMFTCLTVFNVVLVFVAVAARQTILDTAHSEAATLLGPYMFSVIGLPISLLIFKRSLADEKNRQPGHSVQHTPALHRTTSSTLR